jgi:hypothetical protein
MKPKANATPQWLLMIGRPLLLIAIGGCQSIVKVEATQFTTSAPKELISDMLVDSATPAASAIPAAVASTGDGETLRVPIPG